MWWLLLVCGGYSWYVVVIIDMWRLLLVCGGDSQNVVVIIGMWRLYPDKKAEFFFSRPVVEACLWDGLVRHNNLCPFCLSSTHYHATTPPLIPKGGLESCGQRPKLRIFLFGFYNMKILLINWFSHTKYIVYMLTCVRPYIQKEKDSCLHLF